MTEPPRVSVILATCRRMALALQCVESILRSRYPRFELLIVDQDPTPTLQHELAIRFAGDQRIRYLSSDVQMLSRARNLGMAAASGDIFVFIDDDATASENWLEAYVAAFDGVEPRPGAIAGRIEPRWAPPPPDWLPPDKWYLFGLYDCGQDRRPIR